MPARRSYRSGNRTPVSQLVIAKSGCPNARGALDHIGVASIGAKVRYVSDLKIDADRVEETASSTGPSIVEVFTGSVRRAERAPEALDDREQSVKYKTGGLPTSTPRNRSHG